MPKNRVWLWDPATRGPIDGDHFIKQWFNPEHNIVLSTYIESKLDEGNLPYFNTVSNEQERGNAIWVEQSRALEYTSLKILWERRIRGFRS
jgi:hypothetical protein